MRLGRITIKEFLDRTQGKVRGQLVSDAKVRIYAADYSYTEDSNGLLHITRLGRRASSTLPPIIELDESLISFFGFYSGDGFKGSEHRNNPGKVSPSISISQSEPNLIRFSVEQLRKVFPIGIHFTLSLGEDSAYFMAGEGLERLKAYYGGNLPSPCSLSDIRPELKDEDQKFLEETRNVPGTNEQHLAFYYQHKDAMQAILKEQKEREIQGAFSLGSQDEITASLRRPFKKGAREPGGSSRADEIYIGGVTGLGELFLKILHEIEGSIFNDEQHSTQGLVTWDDKPSTIGELIDVQNFFTTHPYGKVGDTRPRKIETSADLFRSESEEIHTLIGLWARSKQVKLKSTIRINPLWCYAAGLYLAEGTTKKEKMLAMYTETPKGFALGFTSSENTSLEIILRALHMLFSPEDCLDAWKVKVGSQYFPELVVIGLKNSVPMLRGGASGDGKLRTMEISLAVRNWALGVTPCLEPYADKYSHVEPTGAGVARIDFWASSSLCRWFFPLVMYATFGNEITDPKNGFRQ